MPRRTTSPDPLAVLTQPPPDESPEQRAARTRSEAEALHTSERIDAQLHVRPRPPPRAPLTRFQVEREDLKKKKAVKREIKVVLLGQAESGSSPPISSPFLPATLIPSPGKSTLTKQFQLQWASRTLDAERATWRPIVALNVIRGLRSLFDQLETAFDSATHSHSAPASVFRSESGHTRTDISRASSPGSSTHDHSYPSFTSHSPIDPAAAVARDQLLYLRERLLPLISVEDALTRCISGIVHAVGGVYVRSDWQAAYPRDMPSRSSSAPPSIGVNVARRDRDRAKTENELATILKNLGACRDFVREFWHHPYLPVLLKARRIKLEDSTSL